MADSLAGRVVVLTGASSGIGRATALELARRRGTIVLAARSAETLDEVARECEQLGGKATAIPTDVTSESEVNELARRAIEMHGRIDVWINDAGIYQTGTFENTPPEDFRRIIETNFFGVVNGTRAVWSHFKSRKAGTLINVASVASEATMAYTTAYSPSKAAVRNFSDCLRMELQLEKDHDIHVCTVLPGPIDTPLFQKAGSYEGREVKPPTPIYPPEEVANAIADLIEDPAREVTVGRASPAMMAFKRIAPGTYERTMAKKGRRDQFTDRPAPRSSGNLYRPMPEYDRTRGGWLDEERDSRSKGEQRYSASLLWLQCPCWWPTRDASGRHALI